MKKLFYFFMLTFLLSCSGLSTKDEFTFDKIISVKPNIANRNRIQAKFGPPDEREILSPKKTTHKVPVEYWGYKKRGFTRLHLTFSKEKLQSISYDIFENDSEFNLKSLLIKLKADFKVIKEPVRNPHAMPTMCYLIDNSKGISVLVNSYKQAPTLVSFWIPGTKKDKEWFDYSTPEFCIADHCSKVTNHTKSQYNQCEWLEKLLKNNSD